MRYTYIAIIAFGSVFSMNVEAQSFDCEGYNGTDRDILGRKCSGNFSFDFTIFDSNSSYNEKESNFYLISEDLLRRKKYNDTIIYVNELMSRKGPDPILIGTRAMAKQYTGNYQEALLDYNLSISMLPDTRQYNNRGLLKMELSDFAGALSDFDKSIELDDMYYLAYSNKGQVLSLMRRYEDSISLFDKSLRINPRHAPTLRNRAISNLNLNRLEEAERDVNLAYDIDGNYLRALDIKASIKIKKGDYKGALSDFTISLQQNPNNSVVWSNRGNALFYLSQYTDAIQSYRKSIDLNPRSRFAYNGLIQAYKMLGDYEKVGELKKVAETLPHHESHIIEKYGE